ncbi:MAG: [Fe-S]-binding protein, partial [bacterium]
MSTTVNTFLKVSEQKAFDSEHRRKINFNISKYDHSVEKGLLQFDNLELARKRAHVTKWKVMENLDRYLLEFESNFIRKGGKVIWSNND